MCVNSDAGLFVSACLRVRVCMGAWYHCCLGCRVNHQLVEYQVIALRARKKKLLYVYDAGVQIWHARNHIWLFACTNAVLNQKEHIFSSLPTSGCAHRYVRVRRSNQSLIILHLPAQSDGPFLPTHAHARAHTHTRTHTRTHTIKVFDGDLHVSPNA